LALVYQRLLFVWNTTVKIWMLRNSRLGREQLVRKSAPAATTNADAGRKEQRFMLRANHTAAKLASQTPVTVQ